MLGDLVLVGDAADALADLAGGGVAECAAGPVDHLLDRGELALGRGQQVLAFSRAFRRELRVAAHHQPFAGELVARDLGEVGLVEQRQLQIAGADQLADLRGLQRGDEPGAELFEGGGVRVGDHRPVADQDHPVDPEPLPDRVEQLRDGARVSGVPGVDLHRHRTTIGRAHQPPVDLQLAVLAVAAVPERGQRAAAALEVGRGQVVEHEPTIGEVAAGERLLDPLLTLDAASPARPTAPAR